MAGPGGRKPEPEPLGCAHIHSFIHSPRHPRPGRHLGSHGGEPAPEFQEGKERLHRGEQTPRGAPEANSVTPSTAGAQRDAPHSDTGDPPADPGGDWAPRGQFWVLGRRSGEWAQVCPLWICVRRPPEPEGGPDESPTPRVHPEGPPTGAQRLGCPCLCTGDPGLAQGPGDISCLLPMPADGPVSTRPGPAESSGDARKGARHLLTARRAPVQCCPTVRVQAPRGLLGLQ